MADEYLERVYNIPLRSKTKRLPRPKRANGALNAVREYVCRHVKADPEDVWLDTPVNEAIWARGRENPPAKLRVRVIRFEDGVVEVSLPEE